MSAITDRDTTAIVIRQLTPDDHARWDAFVVACPEATFFHRAGWQTVLERAFGHPTYFLYAEREGVIVGVLPLGRVKSRLFGDALISLPFCVYGGVAATDPLVRRPLIEAACALARELGVDHLELRNRSRQCPEWPCKDALYVTFRRAIAADADANLKAIPRKQRAMVRKGIDAGLVGELDRDVERLFDAYSESVRNLGTPVFPKRYFGILKDVFGDDCEVLTVTRDGATVASVMSFYFRDEVLPYYGGGKASARDVKGNDFMYWDLLRRAGERGCRVFDYGRSKVGTGSFSFKKNWGFEPEPLYYEFYLVRATHLPDVNPLNPKYRLFIAAWQKLPLWLSRRLGPLIARSLG
ncbi:FemAB-related protein (PEP-CTERM system-associated) [Plasticicumulans lactativorans]|uniref:FemAB-related protein (PEP-CTERM system-associated) n=1 Tax=Plasticicumulans lactativorans TaxID=1133106 RepID=A0A4R2LAD8_9GAMM|nr:FemAB family XrtA/PEP-CTERM system-associated protein [Plasticicumulans lactativorans]TCO83179.1 FemAB-related protein (PEP-CTERM system-associated) [Plasticicumulans lactativorans]